MNIKFLGTKVARLSLEAEDDDTELEDNFSFSLTNAFSEEDDKAFIVSFSVELISKEEGFKLDLEYIGFFEADASITEEFRNSHFPSVNAPAIAYPFMRSFVNTVTVNAGLNSVILPTINFQQLAKQQPVDPESKQP